MSPFLFLGYHYFREISALKNSRSYRRSVLSHSDNKRIKDKNQRFLSKFLATPKTSFILYSLYEISNSAVEKEDF